MKRNTFYIAVFGILIGSCVKDKVDLGDMHLVGVGNGQVVNVNLKSGNSMEYNIGCYVFTSCVYDETTGGYGYVSCDSVFHLFDANTGDSIIDFPLPSFIGEAVINQNQYELIGLHWVDTINYVLRADLSNGNILSDIPVDIGGDIKTSTYFFDENTGLYKILRADNTLISIDPNNGTIINEVPIFTSLTTTTFDPINDKLIGVSWINSANYVALVDVNTGAIDSQYEIQEQFSFYSNVASLDTLTNSLIIVNTNQEAKFIDINSGQITGTYPIGFDISELQFWREN